ncbi:MAG: glycosyltransferase family 4 protein [Synechococcales bacterium]|nr:glycosyltransferase family 4 protein [Synechococcales bacterium]
MVLRSLKLLFVSTPVGPLGSGLGGGVELTLKNLAIALQQRGHSITVVAPVGSTLLDFPRVDCNQGSVSLVEILGELQETAQSQGRTATIGLPGNSVLGNFWQYAYQVQESYDGILNFAYDWLPFYLTSFFQTPIAHLVSMGSLSDAMDSVIQQVAQSHPGSIAVHSLAQAATFEFGLQCACLENGFDLSQYEFQAEPQNYLAWVGRIAPEKGLEDAVSAVMHLGIPLKIFGVIQDADYWQHIQQKYPDAPIVYEGFLTTEALQKALGAAQALIMTPKWVEAFGNVAIEALACGTPVIAYARGGPAEIVRPGETGWLATPDSITDLIAAIQRREEIPRIHCRQAAEQRYSLTAFGDRVEAWLAELLQSSLDNGCY